MERFTMRKCERILVKLEEGAVASLLVLMSGATFANIVGRYCFNSPIQWAEEFSRYAFIWLVFVAAVVATVHKKHILINIAVIYLPQKGQTACRALVELVTLVLMAIMVYYGWVMVKAATQPTATLGIPQYWVYMAVPVSGLLIFYHTLMDLTSDLLGSGNSGSRR
jgi:TRAP-type C4-dicarboxylate transport system permease small subunit